jgi:hypothetical protein
MTRATLVGMLFLVAGQAAAQATVAPDTTARATYQPLLIRLRDAVDQVSARANEFRRDLRTVGGATVLSRAGRLDTVCRETRAALTEARQPLRAGRFTPHQVGARDSLLTAIGALTASLRRECERGLGPTGPGSRADTLRAWGPHRTAVLAQAVSAYHGAAARFARRIGADLSAR